MILWIRDPTETSPIEASLTEPTKDGISSSRPVSCRESVVIALELAKREIERWGKKGDWLGQKATRCCTAELVSCSRQQQCVQGNNWAQVGIIWLSSLLPCTFHQVATQGFLVAVWGPAFPLFAQAKPESSSGFAEPNAVSTTVYYPVLSEFYVWKDQSPNSLTCLFHINHTTSDEFPPLTSVIDCFEIRIRHPKALKAR